MAVLQKLLERGGFKHLLHKAFSQHGFQACRRSITIKARPFKPQEEVDFDVINKKFKRPQSPHLTIYAPQLTSMLSIIHRGTGLTMASYATILGLGTLVLPDPVYTYLDALPLTTEMIFILKFAIAFPFSYHYLNGIRHLSWDFGKFLKKKEVYQTGYIMVATSFAMTAVLLLL